MKIGEFFKIVKWGMSSRLDWFVRCAMYWSLVAIDVKFADSVLTAKRYGIWKIKSCLYQKYQCRFHIHSYCVEYFAGTLTFYYIWFRCEICRRARVVSGHCGWIRYVNCYKLNYYLSNTYARCCTRPVDVEKMCQGIAVTQQTLKGYSYYSASGPRCTIKQAEIEWQDGPELPAGCRP